MKLGDQSVLLKKTGRPLAFLFLLVSFMWSGAVNAIESTSGSSRGIGLAPKSDYQAEFLQGTYRALIIGNNNYEDPSGHWSSLKTAVADARAVEKILSTQYGFKDIQRLENATRRDVLKAIQNLSSRVESHDSVLLYYAGHGFLDEDTRKGFWVPVDAEGTDTTTFLRNSTIRDELSIIAERAKHTLLISDSCFSGSLLRGGNRGISTEETTPTYYQKISQKKSVQIMTAGGVEYVDDDYNESGHSPFTYFLLNELKHNHQSLLTATELASNVQKVVANNAEQVPENGVLQGAGDELGEFIFINVAVQVEGIPKEKVKVIVDVQEVQQAREARAQTPESKNVGNKPMLPMPML